MLIMSLKTGKINTLNVLDKRRVSIPPPHFSFTYVDQYNPHQLKEIDKWIYLNMNHRYYLGQSIALINNQLTYVTKIGFEVEKELSFFKLACPLDFNR